MGLDPKWKWKVSWKEETRLPAKQGEQKGRLICTDEYGVWFQTKPEAESHMEKIRSQGWDPKLTKES